MAAHIKEIESMDSFEQMFYFIDHKLNIEPEDILPLYQYTFLDLPEPQ